MIYTPAANYSGTDSFTFLVNNGTGNSTPATVSMSIWAGQPATFNWNAAVSGNWSGGANWTGGAAPGFSGQPFYNLNFAPSGTYNVTHDLADGFQLNQMNMGGVVTLAGTNTLTFAANGTMPPQFNQNSANAITVNTPLNLAAMSSFGGSGSGQLSLNALISGSGGMIKNSPGIMWVNNFNNTYSGGTVLNSGTVRFSTAGNGSLTPHFGTGPLTINSSATLEVNRTYLTNSIFLKGGTVAGGNSFSSTLGGPVVLTGITTFSFGTTGGFSINGNVSGTGGLTTTGTTQWSMSGTNSYTGTTTVQAGTIRYTAAVAVAPGALNIASGGKANLNYTGNRVVATLTLGEATMPAGTYGSSASSATNKNDSYFTSTSIGTITVLPPTTTALSLTGGSSPSNAGAPLTFTASVIGTAPTGNVSFYANTTLLGTSALNGSFQASLTTSSLAVGSYQITAQYAGNANNATSTSAALAVEITSSLPAAPTNLLVFPGNNQVSLSWTTSAGATSYYVKRALVSGGPYAVIGNPSNGGYTDLTTVNGTIYFYVISAVNATGEGANSGQVSIVPDIQPSTTTLVSSPVANGTYGDSVTFTATVSVSGAPATGTVTFKEGDTVLGTGSLSTGTASFTTSALAVGTHPITANYGGDSSYSVSVSAPYSYTVNAKLVSITGVTAANKVYDGNTTATLSGGAISSGLIGSETLTVVPGSGAFASPNVGSQAVTASGYSFSGAYASNYLLSAQPTVPNATITARPLQLTGTRIYDGTANAGPLTIANNVDGANLTMTGSAGLAGKNVGSQAIIMSTAVPVRVQSSTGSTGASAAPTIPVTLANAPLPGNTLVAVISTRGTTASRVTSIAQTNVTNWVRATQATNANGTTTEIWYAPNVAAGAGTAVTITQASLLSAAVVMEYRGVLSASPLDKTANTTGNTPSPVTGTTATTTQANELWVGGIGFIGSTPTLGTILNSFVSFANAQSTNGTASSNAKVYALDRNVYAAAAASSGGTLSATAQWSGAVATFKPAPFALALAGSAAANYTFTGASGSVTVSPKALAINGLTAANRPYDGTVVASITGTPALPAAQAVGSGTTADGKPYTGDPLTLGGSATGAFADRHAGTNKVVTITGLTLGGAQAGNYTLTPQAVLTANITSLPVTVSAVSATKTYDGSNIAAGTPTITPPLASGDTASALSQVFQDSNAGAGNKVIVPSIIISDGNGGANYALTLANNTTGTISPAPVTVNFGDLVATYDGTPKATSASTVPTGHAVTITYNGSGVAPTDAGSYPVVATAGDSNYSGSAASTFVIAQAPATVSLDAAVLIYNSMPQSASAATSPAGLAVALTYNGLPASPTQAGSYAVSASVSNPNYASNVATGMMQIQPKALKAFGLASSNKTYDGTSTATLTGTAALPAAEAAGTGTTGDGKPYTGDAVSLTGTPAGAFADQHAGTGKAVTVSGLILGGAQAANYSLVPPGALLADITPAGLTITAGNQNKTYGQTLNFGSGSSLFSSVGLQNGETIGSVTLGCAGGNATAAVSGAPYPIAPSAPVGGTFAATDYIIQFLPGDLTLNKADQTIGFGTLAAKKVGDPAVTLTVAASSGLTVNYISSDPAVADVIGDTLTILTAGETTITASQPGNENYNPAIPVAQPLVVTHRFFQDWASDPALGLTTGVNDGPLDDPDHDGIPNLLEFVLGTAPMTPSTAALPTLKQDADHWVFEYDRSDLARPPATAQVVEYGNNLTGWTPVTIPTTSAGAVTITPGATSDHVSVAIPDLGTQTFARLKVEITP